MATDESSAPFVLEPAVISNYTQLIALLRKKQLKYREFVCKTTNTALAGVLGERPETFDMGSVLDGFLHEKLMGKFKSFEGGVCADFDRLLNSKVQQIKKETEQKLYSVRIGDISEVEGLFFTEPTKVTFKEDMLFDLYLHLKRRGKPLDFLHRAYASYVAQFVRAQGIELSDPEALQAGARGDAAFKEAVSAFVKLRFNREEFAIEAYEGRYLWAEVYVLYRAGRTDLVKQLLSEFDVFFELTAQKFRTMFVEHANGAILNFVPSLAQSEDKFKRFLFSMLDRSPQSDGAVINSVDDYLWMRLVQGQCSKKEIAKEFGNLENAKILFMVYILMKQYKWAIDVLLKSDFNVVAKFFLLRELCLEQNLGAEPSKDDCVGGFRSASAPKAKPMLKHVAYTDDASSSSFSLESVHNAPMAGDPSTGLSAVNPVFLNFMFSIVAKMSLNENKVKLIEMLKNYGDYYAVVPYYIIKYELFNIVGRTSLSDSPLDFFLDSDLTGAVISALHQTQSKKKLIQLHKLMPSKAVVDLLIGIVEEGILVDEPVDTKIIEEYVGRTDIKGCTHLRELYAIYTFARQPTIANLRGTVVCSSNTDLLPYKFVIEKIMPRAIEVIRHEKDRELAKSVFRLGGTLDLNAGCCNRIAHELAVLI
ncbi:hypothetical protein PAPHI01_1215 [Pancytospora philotis]|nr:hypothetical protein PAPHI01_1215 [Pancytospora philotis]